VDGPLCAAAKEAGGTAAQVALAWLLQRSPAVLPIPGTGSLAHLAENVAAASLSLSMTWYGPCPTWAESVVPAPIRTNVTLGGTAVAFGSA